MDVHPPTIAQSWRLLDGMVAMMVAGGGTSEGSPGVGTSLTFAAAQAMGSKLHRFIFLLAAFIAALL